MADRSIIVGDIGGTNARFATANAAGDGYSDEFVVQCADFSSPEQAIAHYLSTFRLDRPASISLAVAGPVVDDRASFTNNSWQVEAESLRNAFSCPAVSLLNDFEAIAYSLPVINGREVLLIGGVEERSLAARDFNVCVIGPGTGLGAAGLVSRSGAVFALETEAGHVGFAPESALQREVLTVLQGQFGRVSDERVVSGNGIVNLYNALASINGSPVREIDASAIFAGADEGDQLAGRTVDLFFEILGQVAGNLVLSLGAFDGAYIAGGVAQRHAGRLQHSGFRDGFENKGRHRDLMARVPTAVISFTHPGLLGAARFSTNLRPGSI